MSSRGLVLCLIAALVLIAASWVPADEKTQTDSSKSESSSNEKLDARQLATRIDEVWQASLKSSNIKAAALADDAEFLRRAYLDLIGKIPTVSETREFLADPRPQRRQELVESLIEHGAFATHFANTWRELLLAGNNNLQEARASAPQLDNWLRLRFGANVPYDRMVAELLTAPISASAPEMTRGGVAPPSPLSFYQAGQFKPEILAASTSRVFLGIQVQCAECHNHPFSHWTQQQFWQFAAFFSGLEPAQPQQAGAEAPQPAAPARSIKIPQTETVVEAGFLDGQKPDWDSSRSSREAAARWITDRKNPYFARAIVNRVWEHFFGRGFVTPVDDLDPQNAPVMPELFNEITRQFVLHDCDLKYLVRAITATRAYQSTSRTVGGNDGQLIYFARMPLRRMTADQLFDSVAQATGFSEQATDPNQFQIADNSARGQFISRFSDDSVSRTEAETSILQALALMNGKLVADATDLKNSTTFVAVADAPFMNTPSRVETLFLATLTRSPTPEELEEFSRYVDQGGPTKDPRAALADVFWALLNSAEFILNH